MKYNFGFDVNASSLSLFLGRAFMYLVSMFSSLLALCISFSLLQKGLFWSVSRALHSHQLRCSKSESQEWCVLGRGLWMCLTSTGFRLASRSFNSEGCAHTAAFVNSLLVRVKGLL